MTQAGRQGSPRNSSGRNNPQRNNTSQGGKSAGGFRGGAPKRGGGFGSDRPQRAPKPREERFIDPDLRRHGPAGGRPMPDPDR